MPIYEYSCQSCGKVIDVLQKVSDPAPEACSECGAAGSLTKILSRSSFVLKGGGWYADLYGSTRKEGASNTSTGTDSGSSSSAASTDTSAASSSKTSTTGSSAPSTSPAPAAASSGSKS
jgi:putative FmdB family regulatory protein